MKEEKTMTMTSGVPIPQFMLEKSDPRKAACMTEEMRRPSGFASRQSPYLSKDETEHLLAEGLSLPHGYPVSKAEEKALKKVRRRIKNKLSAQESRRRKKEYIEGLEKRVRSRERENTELKLKVEKTEEKLRAMVDELFALKQCQVSNGTKEKEDSSEKPTRKQPVVITSVSRATQTGICLQCYLEYCGMHHNQHTQVSTTKETALTPAPSSTAVQSVDNSNDGDSNFEREETMSSIYDDDSKQNENDGHFSPKSSENSDGFLYWQLMRTGDGSPKYDAGVLSPTDSYVSSLS